MSPPLAAGSSSVGGGESEKTRMAWSGFGAGFGQHQLQGADRRRRQADAQRIDLQRQIAEKAQRHERDRMMQRADDNRWIAQGGHGALLPGMYAQPTSAAYNRRQGAPSSVGKGGPGMAAPGLVSAAASVSGAMQERELTTLRGMFAADTLAAELKTIRSRKDGAPPAGGSLSGAATRLADGDSVESVLSLFAGQPPLPAVVAPPPQEQLALRMEAVSPRRTHVGGHVVTNPLSLSLSRVRAAAGARVGGPLPSGVTAQEDGGGNAAPAQAPDESSLAAVLSKMEQDRPLLRAAPPSPRSPPSPGRPPEYDMQPVRRVAAPPAEVPLELPASSELVSAAAAAAAAAGSRSAEARDAAEDRAPAAGLPPRSFDGAATAGHTAQRVDGAAATGRPPTHRFDAALPTRRFSAPRTVTPDAAVLHIGGTVFEVLTDADIRAGGYTLTLRACRGGELSSHAAEALVRSMKGSLRGPSSFQAVRGQVFPAAAWVDDPDGGMTCRLQPAPDYSADEDEIVRFEPPCAHVLADQGGALLSESSPSHFVIRTTAQAGFV